MILHHFYYSVIEKIQFSALLKYLEKNVVSFFGFFFSFNIFKINFAFLIAMFSIEAMNFISLFLQSITGTLLL